MGKMPAERYAGWELAGKSHKIFECYVDKIEPGLKPIRIVGLYLTGENRFLACMADAEGNYYLEITEPKIWRFAEVSD